MLEGLKIKRIKKVKRPVVRPCPCAAGHISCNYVVISHILGCPYQCSYCFLHTFYGKDEIVIYDNNDDIVAQVSERMRAAEDPLRIGTGEYSDSLALDRGTGLSARLIELFAQQDRHLLELKTKSDKVDHLLGLGHKGRTVFAWSVNPEKIVVSDEEGSVSLAKRIFAAKKCAAAGYPVAFHFDPIIFYPGWEKDYQEVIELIFSEIGPGKVAWMSLGALRFAPELKEIIGRRFPRSSIAFDRLGAGEDGKMRYPAQMRVSMFREMFGWIRARSQDVYVYLCMESAGVWQKAGVRNDPGGPNHKYFRLAKKVGA